MLPFRTLIIHFGKSQCRTSRSNQLRYALRASLRDHPRSYPKKMRQSASDSCSLDAVQELMVGTASLRVHRTELTKSDFGTFTLIMEATGDVASVNGLLDDPAGARDQKIRCRYEGVEATATLDLLTNQEFGLSHERQILHFVCTDLEADEVPGEFYEFLVPFAHFGQGDYPTRVETDRGRYSQTFDHIKLEVGGIEWILRHLIEIDGTLYPADEAVRVQQDAGVRKFNLNASAHVALQVRADSIERAPAETLAADICWLLHLALAQRVLWAELKIRSGRKARFLCSRAFALPKKTSGSKPLRNWVDGLIKTYIEAAYEVFKVDPDWWRETLNWYSITCEHSTVESSGMILSVILDRLSSHLLKNIEHPKQIGDDLAAVLDRKARKKELCKSIQTVMEGFSVRWDEGRTNALVGKIKEWNNQPPYAKKIAVAFEQVGLKAPSPDLLNKRHSLAHEGCLDLPSQEALDFYLDLNRQVLVLLLAMLGYRGKFFSLGRGEGHVADFAVDEKHQDNRVARGINSPRSHTTGHTGP